MPLHSVRKAILMCLYSEGLNYLVEVQADLFVKKVKVDQEILVFVLIPVNLHTCNNKALVFPWH